MPLSPADFYAYSQATGAPVADTPEKRAQQAPQVLAFQENRLKAPKQGPGLLDLLGTAALGVGAIAGGVGLARALRGRGFGQAATKVAVEDVTPQAAQNVRRAAAAYTQQAPSAVAYPEPAPSRVATTTPTAAQIVRETPLLPGTAKPNLGIQMVDIRELMSQPPSDAWHRQSTQQSIVNEASLVQNQHLLPPGRVTTQLPHFESINTGVPYSLKDIGELGLSHMEVAPELDTADRLLREYELGKQSRQASRIKAAQQDREMQLRGIGARIIDQLKGESLVDQQNSELPQHIDQSLNAVNSAEDQMTGRVKHALQQNPHLDMSQVEVLEDIAEHNYRQGMEQDEPINVAASQTIGHIPNDQVEEITGPQAAQQFFQQRREELAAQGIRGLRAERMLAEPLMKGAPYVEGAEGYQQRQQKKGLALALQTGDPNVLKVFQTGQLPETVQLGAGASQLGEVPTAEFIGPTTSPEIVEAAKARHQERVAKAQNWLNTKLGELEPQRQQILQERRDLVEQHAANIKPQLAEAYANNQLGRAKQLEGDLGNLRTLWQNPELGMHRQDEYRLLSAQIEGAKRTINESIAGMQVQIPQTLKSWSGEPLKVVPNTETGELELGRSTYAAPSNVAIDPETNQRIMRTLQGREIRGIGGLPGHAMIEGTPGAGHAVGIYGIETGAWGPSAMEKAGETMEYTEAAMQRPTKTPPSRTPLTQQPTDVGRQGIDLTRTIQGIYASGRPTAHQEVLNLVESLKKQQGISAVGEASPLRFLK